MTIADELRALAEFVPLRYYEATSVLADRVAEVEREIAAKQSKQSNSLQLEREELQPHFDTLASAAQYFTSNGMIEDFRKLDAAISAFGRALLRAPQQQAEPVAAWMICEPGCEYGPTFGTENAAWSALTKAPPGSELVELVRRKP